MVEVVIADAIRTPLGKRNGWLREQHPVKLGSHVVRALLKRSGLDNDRSRPCDLWLRQSSHGTDPQRCPQCRSGCRASHGNPPTEQ